MKEQAQFCGVLPEKNDYHNTLENGQLLQVLDLDKASWLEAMDKEMESLCANDVWDFVQLPEGRKAVGSKWVFKRKQNADGELELHKA